MEKDGVRYLAGYQVILKKLPDDYAATKYWSNADPSKVYSKLYVTDADDGTEDSQRTGDLPITVLKGNHEMLILAQEAKAGTQSNSTQLGICLRHEHQKHRHPEHRTAEVLRSGEGKRLC